MLPGLFRGGGVLELRSQSRILEAESLKLGEGGLVVTHGEGCVRAASEGHHRYRMRGICGRSRDGGIAVPNS